VHEAQVSSRSHLNSRHCSASWANSSASATGQDCRTLGSKTWKRTSN